MSGDAQLIAGQTGHPVPLVIAVTGHRDLVSDEDDSTRAAVRRFLDTMKRDYGNRGVTVMSALADGADSLVAEEAIALGLPLVAALPMSRAEYRADFPDSERFDRLLSQASEVFELPESADELPPGSEARDRQYAELGVFLCAHCHILLALWDGKPGGDLGGTSDVVRFHHDDVPPGERGGTQASRLILTDDESDLVYHIVCSRDRDNGAPTDGMTPGDVSWFTTDDVEPRTSEMPERYRRVFLRSGEFSTDAAEHADAIRAEAWSLQVDGVSLPPGAGDIDTLFGIADWLAIYHQKRHLLALRATHLVAFLMGLSYIAYSDVEPMRMFVILFILLFVFAAVVQRIGARMAWHRKYLDYRALAEGLRVQFYWSVAGVGSDRRTKFAHDNFLQMQDAELGWIRNVMRVAGMESNVSVSRDPAGLDFVLREWVGDDDRGQLGYFRRKVREKLSKSRRTSRLAAVALLFSVVAIGLFAVAPVGLSEQMRDWVIILMGVFLLVTGVRQSYSFSVADTELVKQYEFMYRSFARAERRIASSNGDAEKRNILRLLGQASLDEHAEWLMMHRERSLSEGELWRMVGG